MKKISSVIAIVLCVVLSLPLVSYASGTPFQPQIHTIDSVDGFYSDSTLNQEQKYLSNYDGSYIDTFYEKFAELESLIDFSYNYWSAYLYYNSNSGLNRYTIAVRVWNDSCDVVGIGTATNTSTLQSTYDVIYSCKDTVSGYYHGKIYSFNFNSSTPQWNWEYIYSGSNTTDFSSLSDGIIVLDTNVPIYLNENIIANGGSQVTTSNALQFVPSGSYNIFFDSDLPYADSNNEIIDPSGGDVSIESNSNHMYFKSCDLGFCEPYGMNDFSNFGGAYLYCKYTVDDWVVNHINDYSLQFNVTSVIGQQQNNFSYTARLDRNGIVTVPFSSIFVSNSPSAIPKNNSFVACVSSKKLNDDYNIANLYTLSESNLTNWLNATKSYTTFSFSGLGWSVLQGKEIQYIVACINDAGTHSLNNGQNANTLVQINPYIFRVSVKLIDSQQNLSGEYAEKFDLFTGDTSTVNSDGLVNDDPFVPDVVPDDPDSLPIVPDDQGNSTTPITIINNGGTWTGSGIISYDPGYRDLRDDVISSENDWGQYFYPFKESNGAGELIGSTLSAMPSDLKVIFIGGFGVLTALGIYRFIRRG